MIFVLFSLKIVLMVKGRKHFKKNINEIDIEFDSATIGESLDMSVEEDNATRDLFMKNSTFFYHCYFIT